MASSSEVHSIKQSLANPNIFVYKGSVLPRNAASDDNNKGAGSSRPRRRLRP